MIIHADAVTWAKEYGGNKFHALLCDPPYELAFMGRDWDKTGVAFDPDTWGAFMKVLHLGAFGMAFASSRGWHRLAVAIEDAGFVIHPSIFGWSFGSGFPKATRVKDAPEFEGHRYGLQALKPALEPIIVFQKPYEGRPIDNITETGAGALNIDGGRIGHDGEILSRPVNDYRPGVYGKYAQRGNPNNPSDHKGRWPANFILLDEEAARRLDVQGGDRKSATNKGETSGHHFTAGNAGKANRKVYKNGAPYSGETGGASRFFYNVQQQLDEADPVLYQAKASRKERDAGLGELPNVEWGKDTLSASIERRHGKIDESRKTKSPLKNSHPTVKPIDLTRYLATLLLPPKEYAPRRIFVPFAGVASEMIGAELAGWDEVVGVEITEEYIPIAGARIEHWTNLEIKPKQVDANWDDLPMFKEPE